MEVVRGQAAHDHIEMLSQRYLGTPYGATDAERVILKIRADRQRAKVSISEPAPDPKGRP